MGISYETDEVEETYFSLLWSNLITTNSMVLSPSSEVHSSSATQEICHNLWNLMVYCSVHKKLPPVPVISQINPVHTLHPISISPNLTLSSHLCLGLPSGPFPSGFSTKTLHAFLFSRHMLHMPCPLYSP
jgi:hypothetical protein